MINFYYYSKQITKILDENKELVDIITSIEKQKSDYVINPQQIINFGGNTSQQAQGMTMLQNAIREKNAKILQIVKSERPNKVYDLVNKFISDLNLFDKSFNDDNALIILLKELPEKHTDAYSEKEAKYIFNLIDICSKITQSINDVKNRAEFIIDEYEKSAKHSPIEYQPLRISTDQDITLLADFIAIFKNVDELYNFICYLYKIDSNKQPLILNNIYTGSWYSELLGTKQVVISIENLLTGIGKFVRDLITGKIDQEKFENKCKKAEAFINLMKIAKENGIDNADVGVFKHLNPFIKNFEKEATTIIEVNEEEILKLQKLEKLTLIEKKNNREKLLDKINLSIENGKNEDLEK